MARKKKEYKNIEILCSKYEKKDSFSLTKGYEYKYKYDVIYGTNTISLFFDEANGRLIENDGSDFDDYCVDLLFEKVPFTDIMRTAKHPIEIQNILKVMMEEDIKNTDRYKELHLELSSDVSMDLCMLKLAAPDVNFYKLPAHLYTIIPDTSCFFSVRGVRIAEEQIEQYEIDKELDIGDR